MADTCSGSSLEQVRALPAPVQILGFRSSGTASLSCSPQSRLPESPLAKLLKADNSKQLPRLRIATKVAASRESTCPNGLNVPQKSGRNLPDEDSGRASHASSLSRSSDPITIPETCRSVSAFGALPSILVVAPPCEGGAPIFSPHESAKWSLVCVCRMICALMHMHFIPANFLGGLPRVPGCLVRLVILLRCAATGLTGHCQSKARYSRTFLWMPTPCVCSASHLVLHEWRQPTRHHPATFLNLAAHRCQIRPTRPLPLLRLRRSLLRS